MADKPVIGFIGLGYMGHGMAANILKAGYPLWVKGNRNRQPVDDLVGRGAQEADSPAAMAATCDIIHLCLSNSAQVEEVVRGKDGILESARPGLIVIDTTTADPVSTMALAAELAARDVTLVDAPLGRTPKEAEEGTLDAMIGASDEMFQKILPLVRCWAQNITHCGPTGAGHKMKLLMNFISLGYGALFSEAVVLGAKVGIAPQVFRQVIGGSRMNNGFFETFMKYVGDRDRDAHKFTIENAAKDTRYLNNMAIDAGLATHVAGPVRNYYAQVLAQGHGQDFVPMLSDHVGHLNGIDMAEAVARGAKKDG